MLRHSASHILPYFFSIYIFHLTPFICCSNHTSGHKPRRPGDNSIRPVHVYTFWFRPGLRGFWTSLSSALSDPYFFLKSPLCIFFLNDFVCLQSASWVFSTTHTSCAFLQHYLWILTQTLQLKLLIQVIVISHLQEKRLVSCFFFYFYFFSGCTAHLNGKAPVCVCVCVC